MENGEENALEKSVNEYVEKVTENAVQFYKDWIEKVQNNWQQSEYYHGQMLDLTGYPQLFWECVFCYEINETGTSVFQSWRDPKEFSKKVMECECLIPNSYTCTANDFVSYEVCKSILTYAFKPAKICCCK